MFYCVDKATGHVDPTMLCISRKKSFAPSLACKALKASIASHPELVTDTAPKGRWNLDILEPQGKARLKEVVGHIKVHQENDTLSDRTYAPDHG